jgi:hypothetical protein
MIPTSPLPDPTESPQPPGSRAKVSHVGQMLYMGVISAFALIVVACTYSLSLHRSIPKTFSFTEVGLLVLLVLAGAYDTLEGWAQALSGDSSPTKFNLRWQLWRAKYGRHVITLGVGLNMFALSEAVIHSGGGLHSPLAPLLTGPAIFGACVAQTRLSMGLVLAVSAVVIGVVDATSHHSPPHSGWGPYVTASLSLLLGAGFINVLQIRSRGDTRGS